MNGRAEDNEYARHALWLLLLLGVRGKEILVARAGLTNLRVHDLRRTVGSWLAHTGASLHLIGDVLNHLDLKTTLGYAYFQTEHRWAALNGHAERVQLFPQAPLRVVSRGPSSRRRTSSESPRFALATTRS